MKNILEMHNSMNSNRLRVILNKGSENKILWVRLRKTIKKHNNHFGESLSIFNELSLDNENWFEGKNVPLWDNIKIYDVEEHKLANYIIKKSKYELAYDTNTEINKHFHHYYDKNYFKAPNNGDYSLIKWLNNWGFFNPKFKANKSCIYCNHEETSRSHIVNDCPSFSTLKQQALREMNAITGNRNIDNLERLLLDAYFKPSPGKKSLTPKKLNLLRNFIFNAKFKAKELFDSYCVAHPEARNEEVQRVRVQKREEREQIKKLKKGEKEKEKKRVKLKKDIIRIVKRVKVEILKESRKQIKEFEKERKQIASKNEKLRKNEEKREIKEFEKERKEIASKNEKLRKNEEKREEKKRMEDEHHEQMRIKVRKKEIKRKEKQEKEEAINKKKEEDRAYRELMREWARSMAEEPKVEKRYAFPKGLFHRVRAGIYLINKITKKENELKKAYRINIPRNNRPRYQQIKLPEVHGPQTLRVDEYEIDYLRSYEKDSYQLLKWIIIDQKTGARTVLKDHYADYEEDEKKKRDRKVMREEKERRKRGRDNHLRND